MVRRGDRGRAWRWPVAGSRLPAVMLTAWLLAAVVSFACGRTESSPSAVSKAAAGPALAFGAERLRAAPTAFDLAFDAGLGALGWVDATDGVSLWLARLDARGELLGNPERRPIAPGAEDLTLAMTAAGPFMVWRARAATQAVGRGLLAGTGGDVPLDLGSAWAGTGGDRGNVALAARQGGALALLRGPEEPCGDGSVEPCFGFRFYALSATGARETEFPLRVPVPCATQAAQLIPAPGAAGVPGARAAPLQYGVCTGAGRQSVLTVFSIEPDRSYAAAHRIFEGCTPLGAALFAGQPSFVADCHGARQLVRIHGADATPELHSLDVRGLVCSAQGAQLRLGEEWLALDRPLEHLELLLDSTLSPPGARAVWTGGVLLVAQARAGQLELERYACVGSELRKLASPLTGG